MVTQELSRTTKAGEMGGMKSLRKRFAEEKKKHVKLFSFSEPVGVGEFEHYTLAEVYAIATAALICGGFIGWVLHAVHP